MSSPPGRRLNRRRFLHTAAQASLAALLSACGGAASPAPATNTPQVASSTPVRLLLWHGWSGAARQVLAQQVERFNRQSASAGVVLQSVPLASFGAELRSAALAGSGPHLALIPNTWMGNLVAEQVVLPIETEIDAAIQASLIPAALAGAQSQDTAGVQHLYGLPIAFDTLGLLYNQSNLLAPPTTTAELLASARGLSSPESAMPIWGLALNLSLDTTIGYLYAFEGRIFDEAGQLVLGTTGRAGAERWLAWVQSLATDQRILARPESSIAVDLELKSGRVLSTFDWAHELATYRNLWGAQLGIAPLPRLAETGLAAQPYVRSDVVTVNARITGLEREIALAFLRFMVEPVAQTALYSAALQPARQIEFNPSDPGSAAATAFRAQALTGLPMPNSIYRTTIEQELRFMLQQVLSGFTTPADAVTEASERLSTRLRPTPI